METQTRLSRHNKFISAENIIGILLGIYIYIYMCVCMCVCIYIYIYIFIKSFTWARYYEEVIFNQSFCRFEFTVFLLPDQLPYQN